MAASARRNISVATIAELLQESDSGSNISDGDGLYPALNISGESSSEEVMAKMFSKCETKTYSST